MDVMPQRHLRRVTLLYLVCVAAVFVFGTLSMTSTMQQRLTYHYNLLFVQSMGFVIALLQWLPAVDALSAIDLDSLKQRTPYEVTLLPPQAGIAAAASRSVVKTPTHRIAYNITFPGSMTAYLPNMDATLRVREQTAAYTVLGQQALVTATCFVYIVIAVAVVHLGLHAAQSIAATRIATRARGSSTASTCVRFAAYLVAALALASPIVVCAVQLEVVLRIYDEVFLQTWQKELGRAVLLYTELYDAFARIYVSSSVMELLTATLDMVNEDYIGVDSRYSVYVYNMSAETLHPDTAKTKLTTDEYTRLVHYLRDSGEGGAARGDRSTAHLPHTNVIVASAPLLQLEACGMLLVYTPDRARPKRMDAVMRPPSLFMLCGLAVLCAIALLCFPYTTLGVVDGGAVAWLGPWGWRISAYWPLQKLLHSGVLLVLLLCAVSLLACKLAEYYSNHDSLQRALRAQLLASHTAADAGARLLDNYQGLISSRGWNISALRRYVPMLSATTLADISRFYQNIFMIETSLHVSQDSVMYAVRAMSESKLPLLANNDDLSGLIEENEYQDEAATLALDVGLWDLHFILAWLFANATYIRAGDSEMADNILMLATSLDDTDGYDRANRSLARTLRAASGLAAIADTYTQQSVTWRNLSTLYAQPLGRKVVHYENTAFASAYATLDGGSFYVNSYNVSVRTLLGPVLAALLLLGADLVVDFVVVARVFARSRGSTPPLPPHAHANANAQTAASGGGGGEHNRGGDDNKDTARKAEKRRASRRPPTAGAAASADDARRQMAEVDDGAAVSSNDYTAPSMHLRVHHRALWSAVRMGVLAATALTLLSAATFVFCSQEAGRLMMPLTQQETYMGSMTHMVTQHMQAMSITAYASAAWLRALMSRHRDDYVSAAQATYNLSQLRAVKWLDAYEQKRSVNAHRDNTATGGGGGGGGQRRPPQRALSVLLAAPVPQTMASTLRLRDDKDDADDMDGGTSSNGGGGGGTDDVNADVMATLQNVTTYASTLLDAGEVDMYKNFVKELQVALTLIDVDKLVQCMTSERARSLVNTLRSYMLALVYMKSPHKFDSIDKAMQGFVGPPKECGVPASALQHMRYAAALLRRTMYDVNVVALSQQLQARALRSVSKHATVVQQQLDEASMTQNHVDTTTMVWAVVVMTWLCAPLVYVVYRAAARVHEALYYS